MGVKDIRPGRVLAWLAMLAVAGGTQAQELPYAESVSYGFRQSAHTEPVRPPQRPRELQENLERLGAAARAGLDTLFADSGSRAVLLAVDGKLVYERYSRWGGSRMTPLGMSVSKSVTALAVGKALCAGRIGSLDDPIERYVPQLAGTSWGEAPIEAVLKMASGAFYTSLRHHGHKNAEQLANLGDAIFNRRMNEDFAQLLRREDMKRFKPNEAFNYNNFDTLALGLLVEKSTGSSVASFMQQEIWGPMGAEADGAWVVTNTGQTSTYHGFSARPRDWLRLGMWVLDELEKKETCFGAYLNRAVSPLIGAFGPSSHYGHQIWVNCGSPAVDFCFVGFGGQYLLFDRSRRAVLYHHAARTDGREHGVPSRFARFARQHLP